MKRDKDIGSNNKNELFFKNLASLYAEKSGNEQKKEFDNFNGSYQSAVFSIDEFNKFDKKVKGRIKTDRIKKWTARLLPLAACFVIFITYIAINTRLSVYDFSNNAGLETPSEMLTYDFISTKLPPDYALQKVDYDRQKAIYYITTKSDNEIVLTVEEYRGSIKTDGLKEININNANAYGISKSDYSLIQYKKDDFLYILTSPYDYYELIRLSKNLI